MPTPSTRRRIAHRLAVAAAAAAAFIGLTPVAAHAVVHAQIQGDGSTWAENAVNQWVSDVQQNGLQVVFTGVGSAQGRKDFAGGTTDFAVSDIGYQGTDPVTGAVDASPNRPYAYVPIAAGGTAFPYHVEEAGQLVRNIRLSGTTIAKIFTNRITNWDDPEITADNNGRQLPSLPIIPIVHSEGAGSTAQFTTWLSKDYQSLWSSFAGYSSFTEYFPRQGSQIAQNGSDGVMNFLTSSAANGAIGYDEYSYALAKNYPVAKVENAAGFFTLPLQYYVAVALTQAQINTDPNSPNYLLQDLTNVYTYGDPRTYPLSSYSYGIIPTSPTDVRMSTAKRQTLADYLGYSTCQGQAEIGPIGYSPLPVNLVQASFDQVAKLGTADPGVNVTKETVQSCHNPTYLPGQPNTNYLAQIAPQPPACDKAGAGPCVSSAGTANANPVNGQVPASATGPAAGTSGSTGSKTGGGAASAAGGAGGSSTSAGSGAAGSSGASTSGGTGGAVSSAASIDPLTGAAVPTGSTAAAASAGGSSGDVAITPTLLAANGSGSDHGALAAVAVLLLVALLAVPPITVQAVRRRREPR